MPDTRPASMATPPAALALVDCDVHVEVARADVLFPYLAEHWIEHIQNSRFKGPTDTAYPPRAPTTARPGSRPEGAPAGSDLALLRVQALDAPDVALAILNCAYAIDSIHHPDAAVALASAVNDWLIAELLEKDARLRASLVVPSQLPELAAREIDRVGSHPGFVQVFLPVRAQHPYGSRLFRPMWEAIAGHDLVAGIHFGGAPGNPPTPAGWPSYYFEEYAGMAQVFASQVTSLITEGVFDSWPNLRVTLIEGGFTWLPAHMWRFDKEWRNLRRTIPWVKRAPSAYIREHVRLTIQPVDAPVSRQQLLEVIDQLGSDELLLYASDYPHLHHADPLSFLGDLPPDLARKIATENARAWYQF
ncbi:MAG TPA: amidohydrolase family protein [Chloroflexota bacterium]|nr:amidohydrolase family protein [Chloroflexota bacterium]